MSTLQRERGTAATCPACGCPHALTIDMTVGKAGPQVSMRSCPRCEHRTWTGAGGTVARPQLLRLLSGRHDFVLQENVRAARRR